jgi:hypothetical protein
MLAKCSPFLADGSRVTPFEFIVTCLVGAWGFACVLLLIVAVALGLASRRGDEALEREYECERRERRGRFEMAREEARADELWPGQLDEIRGLPEVRV